MVWVGRMVRPLCAKQVFRRADLVFDPTLAYWNQARKADIALSFVQPYVALKPERYVLPLGCAMLVSENR